LFDWTVENIDVIQDCQRSYDAREDPPLAADGAVEQQLA
jgi:hypothetical protein